MHIGVFDSGIGGEAIARALRVQFPEAKLTVVNDKAHVPYGGRSQCEIQVLTEAAIQPLLGTGCDIIIIACNTATTAAIALLREKYPDQFFIGIEPMIKTASKVTQTGIIAVCATPATLQSHRYHELIDTYWHGERILEPDCHDWARLIENDELNRSHIEKVIRAVVDGGADTIVLGCTHYHWIKELIQEIAGKNITVLEPSEAIGRRVKELLSN